MIYVDTLQFYPQCKLRSKHWCHLATDGSLEELHAFAQRLGLQRRWFQEGRSGRFPHYDMTASKRLQALRNGAISVSSTELVRLCYPAVWASLAVMHQKEAQL